MATARALLLGIHAVAAIVALAIGTRGCAGRCLCGSGKGCEGKGGNCHKPAELGHRCSRFGILGLVCAGNECQPEVYAACVARQPIKGNGCSRYRLMHDLLAYALACGILMAGQMGLRARCIRLAEVRLQEGEPLENALRRFKRKVQQEDIIKEVKRHSFYLKPGEKKRVKEALARKRNRKKVRKEAD